MCGSRVTGNSEGETVNSQKRPWGGGGGGDIFWNPTPILIGQFRYMAPRLRGINKINYLFIPQPRCDLFSISLFYRPKSRSQVSILIYQIGLLKYKITLGRTLVHIPMEFLGVVITNDRKQNIPKTLFISQQYYC